MSRRGLFALHPSFRTGVDSDGESPPRQNVTHKNPKRVKRELFGPTDHEENLRFVKKELELSRKSASVRWNFDFEKENPLEGKFVWENCVQNVKGKKVPKEGVFLEETETDTQPLMNPRVSQSELEDVKGEKVLKEGLFKKETETDPLPSTNSRVSESELYLKTPVKYRHNEEKENPEIDNSPVINPRVSESELHEDKKEIDDTLPLTNPSASESELYLKTPVKSKRKNEEAASTEGKEPPPNSDTKPSEGKIIPGTSHGDDPGKITSIFRIRK